VVVGLGATFAYGIFIAVAGKTAPRSMPGVMAGVQAVDRMLVVPGVLLIAATGVYLTIDRWEFSDFFVGWGILAVLILIGLGIAVFGPSEEKARAEAEQDVERAGPGKVEFGPEFNRLNGLLARVGMATGIMVILTVYVMTAKPFL
jgi:hypothetical protein